MDATDERKKQIDFTDVYYQGGYTIVVPTGNTDITGYDSIAGKTVALRSVPKQPTTPVNTVPTSRNLTPIPRAGWNWKPARVTRSPSIKPSPSITSSKVAKTSSKSSAKHYVPARSMGISKDKPELSKQVNEALKELKADGTYAKIYKKWFGEEPKQ